MKHRVTRPVLKYYGGKWRLAPWIISHFPAHTGYVEPCGGGASVLLRKQRAQLETYNDIERHIVNFFRMLRDRGAELRKLLQLTPWSRAEYELARAPVDDPLEDARRFFVGAWMSIGNMPFSRSGWHSSSYAGQSYVCPAVQMRHAISALPHIIQRLQDVQIEERDARYIIERYGDHADTLIYFDPPYMPATRSDTHQYLAEVDVDFHAETAQLLRDTRGFVVVSGYACAAYTEFYEEHGWTRYDRGAQVQGGTTRTESLWLSPRTVRALNLPIQARLFTE